MTSVKRSEYQRLEEEQKEENTFPNNDPLVSFNSSVWEQMHNVDQFLSDIYTYHQQGGFWVMLLDCILSVTVFTFIFFVFIELIFCTNWGVIISYNNTVTVWSDVFTPPGKCWATLPPSAVMFIIISIFLLVFMIMRTVTHMKRIWRIKFFCDHKLGLPSNDNDLGDISWYTVLQRIIQTQDDNQLSLEKQHLCELDIYNRILRHENYLIALINQHIIPVKFTVPTFISPSGFIIYLPDGFIFNLKILLFWSPWAPFVNYFQLRNKYKWITERETLAKALSDQCMALGLINLILLPFTLFIQIFLFICSNAEKLRYEPESFFGRKWSNYARFILRHYNELPHEFSKRLAAAHEPASRYLDCFSSQIIVVTASNLKILAGAISFMMLAINLICDDFLHLPGYLAIAIGAGIFARICSNLIPDEYSIHSPKFELVKTLSHIQYMPDKWCEAPHTYQVRTEFSKLFQYRLVGALEDLLSPFITPILFIFFLPNYSMEIVDFLRNYTISEKGVGDICSYATLDVKRFGNKDWRNLDNQLIENSEGPNEEVGGKTELSVCNFHMVNPECELPPESRHFLESVVRKVFMDLHGTNTNESEPLKTSQKSHAEEDYEGNMEPTPGLFTSLIGNAESIFQNSSAPMERSSIVSRPVVLNHNRSRTVVGPGYTADSVLSVGNALKQTIGEGIFEGYRKNPGASMLRSRLGNSCIRSQMVTSGLLNSSMAPVNSGLASIYQPYMSQCEESALFSPTTGNGGISMDMSVSGLYLQELHHRKAQQRSMKQSQMFQQQMNTQESPGIGIVAYQPKSGYISMPPIRVPTSNHYSLPGVGIRSSISGSINDASNDIIEEDEDEPIPHVQIAPSGIGIVTIPAMTPTSRRQRAVDGEDSIEESSSLPSFPDLPEAHC